MPNDIVIFLVIFLSPGLIFLVFGRKMVESNVRSYVGRLLIFIIIVSVLMGIGLTIFLFLFLGPITSQPTIDLLKQPLSLTPTP